MTNRTLSTCTIFAPGLLFVAPAHGQKRNADPRPLSRLDRSHIHAYASVQEYLNAVPAGDLPGGFTRVAVGGSGRRASPQPVWVKERLSAPMASKREDQMLPWTSCCSDNPLPAQPRPKDECVRAKKSEALRHNTVEEGRKLNTL